MMKPEIIKTKPVFDTEWFSLDEKTLRVAPDSTEQFYSINEGNHVAVIAEKEGEGFVLIRQYRPAVEAYVWELPGGHVSNNDPLKSAFEELAEETGHHAERIIPLGKLIVDSGRNQGYLFGYFATRLKQVGPVEDGIETCLVSRQKLLDMIRHGEFLHSLNIAVVFLAILQGFISLD